MYQATPKSLIERKPCDQYSMVDMMSYQKHLIAELLMFIETPEVCIPKWKKKVIEEAKLKGFGYLNHKAENPNK